MGLVIIFEKHYSGIELHNQIRAVVTLELHKVMKSKLVQDMQSLSKIWLGPQMNHVSCTHRENGKLQIVIDISMNVILSRTPIHCVFVFRFTELRCVPIISPDHQII